MSASWTRTTLAPSLTAALLFVLAVPAEAQRVGVRGGASVDPNQFYVGGHFETAPLVERLHFKPNLEIGFGDNVFTTTANLEFVYKWPLEGPWILYAGGGPALNVYSFRRGHRRGATTATHGGINILAGIETEGGLMFELKVGAVDSPNLKLGVGYTWR